MHAAKTDHYAHRRMLLHATPVRGSGGRTMLLPFWNYVALASHLLILAVILLFVLAAPEVALRKVIALELLLLFARCIFYLRATPQFGPMIIMMGKVGLARACVLLWYACSKPCWRAQW
jgi:hypothetical protein